MQNRLSLLLPVLFIVGSLGVASGAERTITATELFDRMRGMWLGQLIGNAAGRATEGLYSGPVANPDPSVPWQIKRIWDADDDTDIEYVALHTLATFGFDCNPYEIAQQWLDHVTSAGTHVASKQAWRLMLDGYMPPETGSRTCNEHWYSLDAQIGTEILGAVSPGLPQTAVDLAGRFGQVTNSGFAVHAAQFYAALYAHAYFEPNVMELILKGLEAIPTSSRTAAVVADVLEWYLEDVSDGQPDWRATRHKLYETYQGSSSFGRYYNWVESPINTGATVLALLYGQGDFKQTVQIAVLAGWDCDCNPATAGGLLGIICGVSGLPRDLTDPALCGNTYLNVSRSGLPDPAAAVPQYDTITTIAVYMLVLAHENILRHGGSHASNGYTRVYFIPECGPLVHDPERPDPAGPAGLVGRARAAGITVTPTASVQSYTHNDDRHNLHAIIDGVTDNSHNGRKPYYTYLPDAADRPPKDWYELTFARPVLFTKAVFHEGDLVWDKLNAYYAEDEPLGGFFEDLTVQILQDSRYVDAADLQASATLDRLQMYQAIEFTFAPTVGTAIRIIGTPGGAKRFTTILELEAEGELLEEP